MRCGAVRSPSLKMGYRLFEIVQQHRVHLLLCRCKVHAGQSARPAGQHLLQSRMPTFPKRKVFASAVSCGPYVCEHDAVRLLLPVAVAMLHRCVRRVWNSARLWAPSLPLLIWRADRMASAPGPWDAVSAARRSRQPLTTLRPAAAAGGIFCMLHVIITLSGRGTGPSPKAGQLRGLLPEPVPWARGTLYAWSTALNRRLAAV